MSDVLSVSVINGYIHQIFLAEDMLHGVSVVGEISQFKVTGGHAYFTLKDENSQLNCTCFNCAQTYVPKVGESVILKGDVDYYVKGGRLSFNARSIQPPVYSNHIWLLESHHELFQPANRVHWLEAFQTSPQTLP